MIYDCFLFANEVELLKLRFSELWDVVDRFVLVESRESHRGSPKPLFYSDNKMEFSQWNEKVDAIVIDSFGISGDNIGTNTSRERYARMRLDDYQFAKDSTIIYGDADEIVRPQIIQAKKLCCCETSIYYYFFNCTEVPTPPGGRPVIAPQATFQHIGFEKARWIHGFTPLSQMPKAANAAWHFSYLGNFEALKLKAAWGAGAGETELLFGVDDSLIRSRIDNGIFHTGEKQLAFVPIDKQMPRYVCEHQKRLTELGLIKRL